MTFAVAVFYPATILTNVGAAGTPWVKHDLAMTLFVLLIMPLATGILVRSFKVEYLQRLPRPRRIVLLAIFVPVLATVAYQGAEQNLRASVAPPFAFDDAALPMAMDACLRQAVRGGTADWMADCSPEAAAALASLAPERPLQPADAVGLYQATIGGFGDFGELFERASANNLVALAINIFSAILVVTAFWFVLVVVLGRGPRPGGASDSILLIYALLIVWFPARIYSDWYINFYSLAHLPGYHVFWLLAVVALGAIPLLVLLLKPRRPLVIFSSVYGVMVVVFGVLGRMNPEMLWYLAGVLERLPLTYFALALLVLITVLAVLVLSVVEPPVRNDRGARADG